MGQNPGGQSSNGGQAAQSGQQTQNGRQNQSAQGAQQTQSAHGTQQNQPAQENPRRDQQPQSRQRDTGEQIASWFTETIVRTVVAVFGVALLLLALGQLVGVDLLSTVVEFLASGIGVWLVIAFFAVLLIVAASKSWNISRQ